MRHIGQILKNHIEKNCLVKQEIANAAGISSNYLSTIFKQESCDAKLLERLYIAAGLNPAQVFEIPETLTKNQSDINANTLLGNASVQINQSNNLSELLDAKDKLIEEKERTIQILMKNAGIA